MCLEQACVELQAGYDHLRAHAPPTPPPLFPFPFPQPGCGPSGVQAGLTASAAPISNRRQASARPVCTAHTRCVVSAGASELSDVGPLERRLGELSAAASQLYGPAYVHAFSRTLPHPEPAFCPRPSIPSVFNSSHNPPRLWRRFPLWVVLAAALGLWRPGLLLWFTGDWIVWGLALTSECRALVPNPCVVPDRLQVAVPD